MQTLQSTSEMTHLHTIMIKMLYHTHNILNQVSMTPTNKNNLYTPGQCTFYLFDKCAEDGNTISTFWRDAKNWASQAQADGFIVNNQPKKGAIFQTPIGVWGHVAYVERVNMDGGVFISEMNYIAPYSVSTRTISASEARNYNYIH